MHKLFLKFYDLFERLFLKVSLKNEQEIFHRHFMGNKFSCQNKWSFLSAIKEIYIDECYKISSKININSILDVGANLGFSIGYFKKQFPDAQITAFEADPQIFRLLKNNVLSNNLSNVSLINGAAWIHDGKLEFFQDHSQGGSLIKTKLHTDKIETKCYDIKKFVDNSQWDLLKIDVEGAEIEIIKHLADSIHKFKLVFIEYHEDKNKTGRLSDILGILERTEFKYSLFPVFGSLNLFSEYHENEAFDLQLNIHAARIDQIKLMKG